MWEREFQFLLHVSSLKGPCVSQTISRWLPFDETNASQVHSSNGKSLLYTINSKKTNKWKHHRKCFINVVAWFCLWSTDNLGQNDWNSKPQFPLHVNQRRSRAKVKTRHFPIPDFLGGRGGGYKFFILIYFVQDSTGSRGDVFVVRTSKPVENLWKNGLFMIPLQFRYTFYRPQTKRRHFVPRSPFGRDAVCERGYGLRLLIFKSRSGSDKKRRNRLQFTVDL